jgi:hypothetical protein
MVSNKVCIAADKNFLIISNFYISYWQRFSHRLRLDFIIGLYLEYAAGLSQAITLLQIKSDHTEKTNDIGTDGMSPCEGTCKTCATDSVEQGTIDQNRSEPVQAFED